MHHTLNGQNKYSVLIPFDINSAFAYSYNAELCVGQLVIVSFRNREVIGVISANYVDYDGDTKQILSVLPYKINDSYVKFCEFMARYTMNNIGNVIRLLIPFSIDKILAEEKNIRPILPLSGNKIILTELQAKALALMKACDKSKAILLHGIPGSGKTEVFLEFIKDMKQVLILVPEVSLSDELAKKVSGRVKLPVYIWHHSISPAKKRDIWKKAVNGEQIIIVGARSALFIPFSELKCIIIDEEHDSSFKQSEGLTYNARDMGVYLANLLNIPIILSSATPSIESYNNAVNGKYEYIRLSAKFFENKSKPNVYIDDLRKQRQTGVLSEYSIRAVNRCLEQNKQAMVFVNRRGHTPKILCSSCGWKVSCPHCDTWLCYHLNENCLICHHCGYKSIPIRKCKECGEETLIGIGAGVEKAEASISTVFPNARIMSLSSDNMNTPAKISTTLAKITQREVDIIVGTQIISKGHNFPALNTIIVTCLDAMLYGDDFRIAEKAFQTTYQIAGRAGRFAESGDACIVYQTYNPTDMLVNMIASGDMEKFYDMEISNRKMMRMPPFGKMISILISSASEQAIADFAKNLVRAELHSEDFKVLGPIIPSFPKINNVYRLRFIVMSGKYAHGYVRQWISRVKIPRNVRLSIDVDPQDFF